jgi:hypothetical protein
MKVLSLVFAFVALLAASESVSIRPSIRNAQTDLAALKEKVYIRIDILFVFFFFFFE